MRFRKTLQWAAALVIACLQATPGLHAAAPVLDAEETLFDGETQSMVARGEAVFTHDDFRIEADEVRYFQREQRAEATGNVRFTRPGFRLVADRLVYNVQTRSFEVGRFRAGYPPLLIEGESGSGSADEFTLDNVVIHLGEPDTASPNVTAEQVIVRPDDRVMAVGARPGVGPFRLFRIPNYSRELVALPALRFRGEGGYRGNLGAFIRSEILIPTDDNLLLGGNLDLYSQRGVLFGPSAQFDGEIGDSEVETSLNTGWIADQGGLGLDYFLREIPQQRYFAQLRHKQLTGERLYVTGDINLLSDPEVLRDFRPEVFDRNHYPDSFVEASYHFDNVIVSALTRFEGGGDYATVERLPELRADLLTTPLFAGLYHTGYVNAAATSYSVEDAEEFHSSYVHGYYGLRRPFVLTDWLTLTPRAGGMYAHYEDAIMLDDAGAPPAFAVPAAADHYIGEMGADLAATFHAQWEYRNDTWQINGLRHILRPVVYWRHYGSSGDEHLAPLGYGAPSYLVQMPPIDLRDWMADDSPFLGDQHFTRVGVENVLQTRAGSNGASRRLAALNLYQDYAIDDADFDRTYAQLALQPAPFLDLYYEMGMDSDSFELQYRRLRMDLRSASKWRATLYLDYLDGYFHDYVAQVFYQATRNWGVIASAGYDADAGDFDRQALTLVQQIGSFWQVRYSVNHNDGSRREDDWGFSVAVRLSRF